MRHRILVVDDDAAIRDLLTDALAGEGYTVATADDGVDALSLVFQSAPALILLDLNMPRLDGAGFVRALHEQGLSAPDVACWVRRLGAVAHLGKPFDLSAVLALVARVLAARGQVAGAA